MAGFTFRQRPKSRPGTAESFANTGHSFVPAGTSLIGLNNDPAINGWAIFVAFPSAVRRGIFVEPQTKIKSSPVGAAYSIRIPDDVAPTGAWSIFVWRGYKDASPTDLPFAHTPAPIPAGLANPAPARACVGGWPFAPVLAASRSLQPATNPNGIESFSPRLRGSATLGMCHKFILPGTGCIIRLIDKTPLG